MPTAAYHIETIRKELDAARGAAREGNNGKARVCSRRAAGEAIAWYLEGRPGAAAGVDAVSRLRYVKETPAFPAELRDAAARLAARISETFEYPVQADPVADAALITDYFIRTLDAGTPR